MSRPTVLTARHAAWKTLNQYDVYKHDTADILHPLLERTDRPAQATDIVYGVIRHRNTLDRILTQCADVAADRVKPAMWNLLRIGVYELVFTPDTADYAIINEAVELTRKTRSAKTSGFVNAVLRTVQRSIESRCSHIDSETMRRLIPQASDSGCLFKTDLLPDPSKEPTQYLCTAYSIPQPLIQSWLAANNFEKTRTICEASNRGPSVILQPNILRNDIKDLTEQLQQENVDCEFIGDAVRIRDAGKVNKIQAYLDGLFYVQDTTAFKAIELLSPQPGWTVLDLCAAPGGKSIALAMLTKDSGLIIASDVDSKRLGRVRENAKRMRLQSIEVVLAHHVQKTVSKHKRLDAIVLDVPCSNTGVLARRVEARWRWNHKAVIKLRDIQKGLLQKAAGLCRSGTKILYSTCSIQPDENQQQIQTFLAEHKKFILTEEQLTLPSARTEKNLDHDGGYVAVLQMK
ncbi:MAG: transcription antitermination factor NusB [Planctomycetota bacterium]|jgi:16S rRNA (cytosine967-C5)-methyltransferase